jgi:hypothetical protein
MSPGTTTTPHDVQRLAAEHPAIVRDNVAWNDLDSASLPPEILVPAGEHIQSDADAGTHHVQVGVHITHAAPNYWVVRLGSKGDIIEFGAQDPIAVNGVLNTAAY